MSVVGKGVLDGFLTPDEVTSVVRDGLAPLPIDGKRVLVIIPDGTRTMPMPLMFDIFERELQPRVSSLDYLVALGTHQPMDDDRLGMLVGRPVIWGLAVNGEAGVGDVLDLLIAETELAMALAGAPSVADLTAAMVV